MTAVELAMWIAGGLGIIWLMCFIYNTAFDNFRLGFICLAAAVITAAFMFGLIDGERAAKKEQEKMEAPRQTQEKESRLRSVLSAVHRL